MPPGAQSQMARHVDGVQGRPQRLAQELKPGALVAFEFVERDQGEWVITAARPLGKATANPHAGHN